MKLKRGTRRLGNPWDHEEQDFLESQNESTPRRLEFALSALEDAEAIDCRQERDAQLHTLLRGKDGICNLTLGGVVLFH